LRALLGDPAVAARAHELADCIHPAEDLSRSLDAIERAAGDRGKIAMALADGMRQT